MTAFIRKCILFLLPLIAAGIITECLLHRVPNDYSLKRDLVLRKGKDCRVLFLGSSHAYYDVDPSLISLPTINLAEPSQTLDIDWKLFRKYEPFLPSLEVVAIPVSYFSFNLEIQDAFEKRRLCQYRIYHHLDVGYNPLNYAEVLNRPFFQSVNKIWWYFRRDSTAVRCDSNGWGLDYHTPAHEEMQHSAVYSEQLQHFPDTRNTKALIGALDSLITRCERRGIRVILYSTPNYPTYLRVLNPVQLQNMERSIQLTLSRHPGLHYYNYFSDSSFAEAQFYDATHLNELGARRFSLRLDSIIRNELRR